MVITKLEYNWWFSEGSDDCYVHEVGVRGVKSIIEHRPAGEGDKWFYDVSFDDGRSKRIFNPNIAYSKEI